MKHLRILCIFLITLLAGCSQLSLQPEPLLPESDSWQAHQQRQQALTHWQMRGKIGIRTPRENHSANILWQQDSQHYQIELTGPLGQGGARIDGNAQGVQIDIAGEDSVYAESPEQLMDKTLGWQFPVRELLFWIKGIPAPASPYLQVLDQNRLKTLEQNGWNINYLRYTQQGEHTFPRKLVISRDTLVITIVTKEWLLSS
ncbi:MAG: lipoprotein insertase outer membrane protein LolB [Amphritea sp.]